MKTQGLVQDSIPGSRFGSDSNPKNKFLNKKREK